MARLFDRYNRRVQHAGARTMGLRPGGSIRGSLRVPGSKSIAQRALLLAGLASGRTRISGLPRSDDVDAALALVEACGVRIERLAPAAVAVVGRPPGPHRGWAPPEPVSAGESGTLARIATGCLALAGKAGGWHEIGARGTLLRRESRALFDALARAGVGVQPLGVPGGWPVRVRAIGPPSEVVLDGPRSSQEVSALLVALAAWPDAIDVRVHGEIPSGPYVDLTRRVIERFGARVDRRADAHDEHGFRVKGPLDAPADPIEIEPDASSAAVALAAGCLSGGRVEVQGIRSDSAQPDVRAVEMLSRFGCKSGWTEVGAWAEGPPTKGAQLDCADCPDLAPVLAAVAAGAALRSGSETRLTGLATLAGKESSRIEVLASGLRAVGLRARAGTDALEIAAGRGRRTTDEIVLDPHGDHRMAFAFALLGLFLDGVAIADPGCVGKSWPGFWMEIEALGARVARK